MLIVKMDVYWSQRHLYHSYVGYCWPHMSCSSI